MLLPAEAARARLAATAPAHPAQAFRSAASWVSRVAGS
jgi:hypothetical protein